MAKLQSYAAFSFSDASREPWTRKNCDEIYPNGFYFPVGKHMAYFIKEDGFILIIAVLGQSQLPEKHLK